MEIYHNLNSLPKFRNAVLTVGTFDGVHKGHQKILKKINHLAVENNGESILITFHPHPRLVINPHDESLKLINTMEEKIHLLESYGVDNLVVVPFTKSFSALSAEEYVEDFLIKNFNPKVIVIGYDHHFGKERKGDISLLKKYQESHHFEISLIEKLELDRITISSTKIRKALSEGKVEQAKDLMNHPYFIKGEVIEGQKIGRTIHFPTANISLPIKNKLIPKQGVYEVNVILEGKNHRGMLNIGNKPTFEQQNLSIEVHIFDFNRNIYGQSLIVEFIKYIRKEVKFESLEALKAQLILDKQTILKGN